MHEISRGLPQKAPAHLYVPVVALQGVQRQHIGHLLHAHGVLQVLLVGHDQDGRFLQMLVLQQCEELRLQRVAATFTSSTFQQDSERCSGGM